MGASVRSISIIVILFALWLLMSGIYKPIVVGLGLISTLLVLFIVKRMDREDGDQVQISLSPFKFIKYMIWLMVEIARANWTVTKAILARDMKIRQHLFRVPISQKTDLAQVIFANSITLTPGTITVETEGDHFLVHAVCYNESDPEAIADMDARVTACEKEGTH